MFKSSQRNEFHSWLSNRIRRASTGEILDFDTGERVDVETARSEVFLDHTHRKGAYNKKNNPALIRQIALDQAKADPNDPFTFARVKTHLENGLCNLDDYGVTFKRVSVDLLDFSDQVIGRKMADVPMKVRRA